MLITNGVILIYQIQTLVTSSKKMRIYFTGDTGITKITYSINSGSEVILDSSSYDKGNSSTNGYINLDLSNVATSKGLLYNIVIKLYRDTITTTFATLQKPEQIYRLFLIFLLWDTP